MSSEIIKWRSQIDLAKAKRDKELGKQEMLMKTLKEKHGIGSMEELKEKIAFLEQQYATLSVELEEKMNEFRTKYADRLAIAAR